MPVAAQVLAADPFAGLPAAVTFGAAEWAAAQRAAALVGKTPEAFVRDAVAGGVAALL